MRRLPRTAATALLALLAGEHGRDVRGQARARVEALPGGEVVAEGQLFVPHRGAWDVWGGSSFLRARLEAGRAYRIRIDGDARSVNMSAFRHFERYTGGAGGVDGPRNRVHVAAVRVLARGTTAPGAPRGS